jgi:hypothetical protein
MLVCRSYTGIVAPAQSTNHGEHTDWLPRTRIILESGEEKPFEPFEPFDMSGHEAVIKGRVSADAGNDPFRRMRN